MAQPVILIVSKDEDARLIFGAALQYAGYAVRLVDDPDTVLDAVRDAHPALVITNYPTRLADGRTVTQVLRANPLTSATPVLNATSHVLADELRAAAADGVDVSLPLPLSPLGLIEAVGAVLVRGRTRDGAPPLPEHPRLAGATDEEA